MNANDIVLLFTQAFDGLNLPYMLVGSYSSNLYGRPRSTQDADFVVQLPAGAIGTLCRHLGPAFSLDPQMSFETVTATMRHVILHDETAFKVELFLLSDDAHDRSRFQRRRQVDFEARKVWMPTAEDVIVTKLRWSKHARRSKDVEDVANVIAIQREHLDLSYIRHWCDQHGTRELFERLLKVC